MNAWLPMSGVLLALASLFGIGRLARMRGASPEHSRKFVHVGMGIVALSFPWLFHSPVPVLVLAALAGAALITVRRVRWTRAIFACVLHDVARRSYGEFAFIAGVAGAFALAHGSVLAYCVPVAILTFADSAAGLLGSILGRHRYRVADGWKTVEGSSVFFAIALACFVVPFHSWSPERAALAAVAAFALTGIEAASPRGLDNASIPLLGGVFVRLMTGAA